MAEQHEKTLVPQIRFAGFTDPWEQRKLGELFEEHSEKDRDDLPALTIIQGGGTVHRDESNRNLQFDRSSLSNYKVVDTGDFIVHLRSFEGGLEKATCYGLVSPAYHIFRGKNVDSDFYYLYFRSKRFIDVDLKPHVYGIRDGRSIDIEGMKTIFIPWTNLAEQRQIGAFFDHLDSLITLHQRKYDKLCVLKKSMLDKMFPKGGSLYPEIRFAGFTDPWEQRKLGELFEESDERASDREILSVSVANGIYPASESDRETNPGASLANYKVVHSGDVVYNSMRMWQGAVDASRYDGIVSPAYVVAKPNSEVYARFFARLLRQPMLLKQYQQVSQGNSKDTQVLKFDDFASIEISMPASENEQRQIGAFFDRLDSLITLHQRKLELLRNIKKSMLDKMFV
jgi:type I restriction enzyme S subunit